MGDRLEIVTSVKEAAAIYSVALSCLTNKVEGTNINAEVLSKLLLKNYISSDVSLWLLYAESHAYKEYDKNREAYESIATVIERGSLVDNGCVKEVILFHLKKGYDTLNKLIDETEKLDGESTIDFIHKVVEKLRSQIDELYKRK